MSKVLTFSRAFPSYHPRKSEPTYFVEKIWKGLIDTKLQKELWSPYILEYKKLIGGELTAYDSLAPKYHTIRAGHRFKVGDIFSPRVWSGLPYRSKQITLAPDVEVKKVWDFEIQIDPFLPQEQSVHVLKINDVYVRDETYLPMIAKNDGLTVDEFLNWFIIKPQVEVFSGQIICWNENINY